MASERENITDNLGLGTLNVRHWNIAGNQIRAFYDTAGKLVFVIDDTISADKPNALLVINPVGDRKWDDILSNDYGVSLESIRPKKNNKYQKLDIEYSGLAQYDNLIQNFEESSDLEYALSQLKAFRGAALRRAASERLHNADIMAENARETIDHTNDTIAASQLRIKELRAKLNLQKKSVGREPTKQSASKILRTESQIDAVNEKMRRAKKRLVNAQRRLAAAEEDADVARAILARPSDSAQPVARDVEFVPTFSEYATDVMALPQEARVPEIEMKKNIALPAPDDELLEATETYTEPKAEEMAEEVKPLFDKDPNILDEEIAFKPIDFDVPSQPVGQSAGIDEVISNDVAPLSFTPPTSTMRTQNNEVINNTSSVTPPVLDTLMAVDMPKSTEIDIDVDKKTNSFGDESTSSVVIEDMVRPAPVSPSVPGGGVTMPAARPVSPVAPVAPVASGNTGTGGRRPTFMYYVLLIALIIMSIFTLWLYQKSNNDTVPDLAATNATVESDKDIVPASKQTESPFIVSQEAVVEEAVVAPVEEVQPEPAPAPAPGVQPAAQSQPVAETGQDVPEVPVIDESAPSVPVVAEPDAHPVSNPDTPFITEPEPAPAPAAPVLVNKPVYNAGSQNENMFVASDDYETDVIEETTSSQLQSNTVAQTCEDGTMPDTNGCCGDELYTNIGDGYACCSQSTGDCYPPIF